MKSMLFLLLVSTAVAGCGIQELRKDEVASMIRKELKFPQSFCYEINTTDPASAESLISTGLETRGFVSIKKVLQLNEIGKPIIKFAEKAVPFLLPAPAAKDTTQVQMVKIADVELTEVTAIKVESRFNFATVNYTLVYKNITPFAALIKKDLTQPETRQIILRKYSTGWLPVK